MKSEEKYSGIIEEDTKSIKTFIWSAKKKIVKRYRINYWIWIILSITIMAINIIIIVISIYILIVMFNQIRLHPNDKDFIQKMIAPSLILILALLSFISFSVLSVFQTKSKRRLYKSAYLNIQFESIKFSQNVEEYKNKDAKKLYLQKLKNIKNNVYMKEEKKLPWHQIIKAAILKDADA